MSIHSRGSSSGTSTSGYVLDVDEDELKYIAALLAVTRLGGSTATSNAAFSLIQKIGAITGTDDYILDALVDVDPRFVISTTSGILAFSSSFVTIDV